MQHRARLAVALLVAAALALPGVAGAADSGSIRGIITDATTDLPFVIGTDGLMLVDAFNTATGARYRTSDVDEKGYYQLTGLPAGTYKVRFRWFWGNELLSYRWNNDKANYDTANGVVVAPGGSVSVHASLPPVSTGTITGQVTEAGTGTPLGGDCFGVQVFEASGISIGWMYPVDSSGMWTAGYVPAGSVTVLVYHTPPWGGLCPYPTHLDRWFKGASGHPFLPANLVADPYTFSSATLFTVTGGATITGIDFSLKRAPLCRGELPTIFGTTLPDVITGTAGRDVIVGLGRQDRITGLGGDDLICGNAGRDIIRAGPGDDVVLGGTGNDRLYGQLDDDLLRGGRGTDSANGGFGVDVCVAETVTNCP